MEPRLKELLKGVHFERDQTNRNKLKVFLICLGISVFIWFLIVLSNESTTTLDYPIVYTHIPTDLILVNHPDSILSFRIASGGFELMTLKYLTRKRPVEVSLTNLTLVKQNEHFIGTYSTSRIAAGVTKDFNFSEELVSISPDVLTFRFEPLIGKMVPVIPKLDLSFEAPYRLSDSLKIIPDSVKVSGPEHIISNIHFIETKQTKIEGIKDKVIRELQLNVPENGQSVLSVDVVKVEIQSDKFTESMISVPVVALNSSYQLKIFPSHVTITYLVSLKDFNRISPDMFVAGLDVTEESTGNMGTIILNEKPSFVEVTRIEPENVEFLVIKQ